ncbi:MAG: class I SAM-dependent methyltransferase [Sphingobacteriales bacterium]|nr:class I SAM-dependent methyltransferase [Sphingobacteriales bacterium]
MDKKLKNHWEQVYQTKGPAQVSWTQEKPVSSLGFIHSFNLEKEASIIDVGGGDSKLVDYLLNEGFEHITVLDISATALEKARQRLGEKAHKVNWVVSDIMDYQPDRQFDAWHDRATFHFLTSKEQVEQYLETARKAVTGYLAIGTFSDQGPDKCSGLPVKQYSEESLASELHNGFDKIRCITEDHITPFNSKQHFLFCSFRKHSN